MKRKTGRLFILPLIILMISMSGCALFKKKCDCPGFGFSGPDREPASDMALHKPEKNQGLIH